MSTLYIITNTVGDNVFSILPGALNGPGGTQVDSDLRLYGQGSTIYGEGVNENLYRITESFACPEKAGSPGVPQDESDLGPGNGINNPLTGQPWYNTTTQRMMVFDETAAGFISAGGNAQFGAVEPTAPLEGDLWYDTVVPQLKIYDGAAFTSVADRYLLHDGSAPMTGSLDLDNTFSVINMVDPTNPQDAATKQYVDDEINLITGPGYALDGRYVNVTGDTMTGDLTMTGHQINFGVMSLNDGLGNAATGPDIQFSAAGLIAATDAIYINVDSDNNSSGSLIIGKGANTTAATALVTVANNGKISSNISNYDTLLSADNDIPNKKYVDDEVAAASSGLGATVPEIHSGGAPVNTTGKDGDIWINGSDIYIRSAGIYRQVFPAQYT